MRRGGFYYGVNCANNLRGISKYWNPHRFDKKLTDEQKKQPIMLIFESFSVIGLILLIIGVVIFENLLLGNIAITLFIIGIVFDIIRYGKSNSIFRKAMALGLALFILVFYVFVYH